MVVIYIYRVQLANVNKQCPFLPEMNNFMAFAKRLLNVFGFYILTSRSLLPPATATHLVD